MYPRLASLLRSQGWLYTPAPPALTSRVLVLWTTHVLHGAGARTQGLALVRQSSTIYIPNLFLSLFFFPPYLSLSGLIPFLVPLRNNINCFFLTFYLFYVFQIFCSCCPYPSCILWAFILCSPWSSWAPCLFNAWLLGVLGFHTNFYLPALARMPRRSGRLPSLHLSLSNRM